MHVSRTVFNAAKSMPEFSQTPHRPGHFQRRTINARYQCVAEGSGLRAVIEGLHDDGLPVEHLCFRKGTGEGTGRGRGSLKLGLMITTCPSEC